MNKTRRGSLQRSPLGRRGLGAVVIGTTVAVLAACGGSKQVVSARGGSSDTAPMETIVVAVTQADGTPITDAAGVPVTAVVVKTRPKPNSTSSGPTVIEDTTTPPTLVPPCTGCVTTIATTTTLKPDTTAITTALEPPTASTTLPPTTALVKPVAKSGMTDGMRRGLTSTRDLNGTRYATAGTYPIASASGSSPNKPTDVGVSINGKTLSVYIRCKVPVGTTFSIRFTVTDTNGNVSNTGMFNIQVLDNSDTKICP